MANDQARHDVVQYNISRVASILYTCLILYDFMVVVSLNITNHENMLLIF